ncbi:MAG TPA: DUF3187 family protein [Planctomycetota bacterium]|nr:DUF3187 family protein [Planctomycetota bacterium]
MNRPPGAGVLFAGCLILFAAVPRSAGAQDDDEPEFWQGNVNIGLGLFQSVSLAPFPALRSGLGPRLPSSLLEDGFEFRVTEDWARMLSTQHQWLLDYDVLRSNLGVSYGISNDLRVDLDFESATRTTGYLETFIIGFHRTFNLSIGNRRQYQNHPQTISILPPDGGPPVLITQHDPQPYAQSAIATGEYALLRGNEWIPDLALSASLRGALHSGDLSSGSPIAGGGSLSMAKSVGDVNFYLSGSGAWFGAQRLSGLALRPLQWSALAGFEIRAASWVSITAQYLLTSGGVDELGDLSRPSNEVTAGFKWDLGRGYLLETAVLENVINPYNTPDFGVHFSLTVRW